MGLSGNREFIDLDQEYFSPAFTVRSQLFGNEKPGSEEFLLSGIKTVEILYN
jgi:hypothetical protein